MNKYHIWKLTDCVNPIKVLAPLKSPELSGFRRVQYHVGCGGCAICWKEKVVKRRAKWKKRLLLYTRWFMENNNSALFATFTLHDDNYLKLDEMREVFRKMMMRLRRVGFKVKYFCAHEYAPPRRNPNNPVAEEQGRLHLHVFFFLDKSNPKDYNISVTGERGKGETRRMSTGMYSSMIWEMRRYWTRETLAYVLDFQTTVTPQKAAAYVTKYMIKDFYKVDGQETKRIQSSQFGWVKFIEERDKEWHGISPEGEKDFVQIEFNPNPLRRNEYTVKGRVIASAEVSNVYKAWQVQIYEEDTLTCVQNDECTEVLNTMPVFISLQALRMARLGLSRLPPCVSAKRSRVLSSALTSLSGHQSHTTR